MKQIDKTKPILVTGATGYMASWIVKYLLEEGHTVHAAVRNPDRKEKVDFLQEIANHTKGELKFFKSDLLMEGSYAEAMEGCELVIHTASPICPTAKDPQRDLIEPAVKGTENVLQTACHIPSVKRVVLTSSCAAIYADAIDCSKAPNGILTEKVWNTTASLGHQAYSLSKTLAEKKAWEICKSQNQWDLVSINPSFIMGPMQNPRHTTSVSLDMLKTFGDGSMKMGAPRIGTGLVDVRDVAKAHILAGFTPSAHGRYITSAGDTDFVEMGKMLAAKFGANYPIPNRSLPKWLLWLVAPIMNKVFTRKIIARNVNIPFRADNSKIRKELGMTFLPMETTMQDAFLSLIAAKLI